MTGYDLALSIALGTGLAAATGLRVFPPLLVASVAAWSGHLHLNDHFAWLGTLPALVMLAVAAGVEVAAYYIPFVDHLLDAIMAPVALIAGTVAAAAVMGDMPPLLKWATAIVAGGGAAGLTQGLTTLLRAGSTATTAGLGNPVVSTAELGGSVVLSLLALAAPFLAVAAVVAVILLALRVGYRIRRRRAAASAAELPSPAAPADSEPRPRRRTPWTP